MGGKYPPCYRASLPEARRFSIGDGIKVAPDNRDGARVAGIPQAGRIELTPLEEALRLKDAVLELQLSGALEEPAGMGTTACVLDDGTVFGQSGYTGECLIRPAWGASEPFESCVPGQYTVAYGAQMPHNIRAASGNGLVLAGYYIISHPMVGAITIPRITVIEQLSGNVFRSDRSLTAAVVFTGKIEGP